ncbi:MAG: hypothetical protein WCE68_00680 [Anaerolineales bacterium]
MDAFITLVRNKIISPLENFTERINIVHILMLSLVITALSVAYHRSGVENLELETRIPFYLADRPLLNKLYDTRIIEANLYVGRELSYVFDFLDAQFISLSVSLGFPNFISPSFYIFTIAIGLMLWQFCVAELKLKRWIGLGMVLLFWTSPNAFLGGDYFRSAKPGVSVCIVALYYLVYHVLHSEHQNRTYRPRFGVWVAGFGIAWAAAWFDREGLYLVGVLMAFLLIWGSVFPSRNILKLLAIFGAVLVLFVLYAYLVAPWLTFYFNHYWPGMSYQQLPWWVFKLPHVLAFSLAAGVFMYIDTLRFLVGNISRAAAFLLIVSIILVAFFIYLREKSTGNNTRAFSLAALGLITCELVLTCAMNTIMVIYLPQITMQDLMLTLYYMPLASTLCMTLALVISQFSMHKFLPVWLLLILLIAAIVGNILAIPVHYTVMRQGYMKPVYDSMPSMLAALRNIRNSHYLPPLDIQRDGVYQFFRAKFGR